MDCSHLCRLWGLFGGVVWSGFSGGDFTYLDLIIIIIIIIRGKSSTPETNDTANLSSDAYYSCEYHMY